MSTDGFDDNPLNASESLDSDEVRNNDGDDVVDPPQRWIEPKDDETLDDRLADEVPDSTPDEARDEARDVEHDGVLEVVGNDELNQLDTQRHGHEEGQIDGTPEDGESFFDVVK